MSRRCFEHLYTEICVAVNRRISRYGLWLLVWESGGDPDDLTPGQARVFVEHHLATLLSEEGLRLEGRSRRKLEKSILGYNPQHRAPEEWLSA